MSGPVTSPGSKILREIIGQAKLKILRSLGGRSASLGGSIFRLFPYLGVLESFLGFLRSDDAYEERSSLQTGCLSLVADFLEAAVLEEIRKVTLLRDLQLHQRLYHDLGLTGDDACELLDNINARFGTTFHKLDFISTSLTSRIC